MPTGRKYSGAQIQFVLDLAISHNPHEIVEAYNKRFGDAGTKITEKHVKYLKSAYGKHPAFG
jgi:hypothetical protein